MLTEQQKNIIISAFMPFNPNKIGVFGSYSRKEASVDSDIDILYELQDTIGLFKLIGLKQDLEEKLNKKVDLVAEKYVNKKLKPFILNDLELIYRNG